MAGCHIAFGAFLAISIGGACPGIAKENPGLQKVRDTDIYIYIYINWREQFHILQGIVRLTKTTYAIQSTRSSWVLSVCLLA